MPEIRTVTTLRRKREEIRRAIIAYEEKLSQAKADLAHVTAAITIFEGAGEGASPRAYIDIHRLFSWSELAGLAKAALAAHGPMDREIRCGRGQRRWTRHYPVFGQENGLRCRRSKGPGMGA